MSNIDRHRETYREEAHELLSELETSLLELEDRPDDSDLIGRVFRALHTIKGSGSMFGFDDIASLAHEVETVFDRVRNGEMSVTREIIDLTLSARDCIKSMLSPTADMDASSTDRQVRNILAVLKNILPGGQGPERVRPLPSDDVYTSGPGERGEQTTYRVRFRPGADIFKKGMNPVLMLRELKEIGNCSILAYTDAVPDLNGIDPEDCYTYWDIIITSGRGMDCIKDVFIFVEDDGALAIDVIDDGSDDRAEPASRKIGEILLERGFITKEDLEKALAQQKRVGEMLVEARLIDPRRIEAALVEQWHMEEARASWQNADTKDAGRTETVSSVRVASDKLDSLVNLVGEMVTVQARLSRLTALGNDPDLLAVAEEVERLTGELRDQTMSIRMLPIGTTFSKFRRLVRDLSKELGKQIELTTGGAETELDKTVIEKLNDPMVHLIRNSIDHGIEPPDIRTAAGKPLQGTIHLSARHSGAHVLIEITDDGAGLDPVSIKAKAVEKGMIAPDAELSEQEIYSLVLAPGFSTAKTVTNVSGRGVGMDVVKRAIDNLRGTICISSQKGTGTTITLKLPLTLAIIEGLLVRLGKEYFVVPLSAVEECVELTREDVAKAHGRHLANVRGQIVPYIRLREQFMISGDQPDIEQIVLVGIEGGRAGFVVDDVIGEHQTVIKTLGRIYRDVDGISGATILGDGTVALILDVPRLVKVVETEEAVESFQ